MVRFFDWERRARSAPLDRATAALDFFVDLGRRLAVIAIRLCWVGMLSQLALTQNSGAEQIWEPGSGIWDLGFGSQKQVPFTQQHLLLLLPSTAFPVERYVTGTTGRTITIPSPHSLLLQRRYRAPLDLLFDLALELLARLPIY